MKSLVSESYNCIRMIIEGPISEKREARRIVLNADLAVVGGGLAGCCAAITAARAGMRVVLVQDRPVLGGNASSEVRLWILGATSHMGNNNRWAREGGVIDEIMVDNMHRNPEGNAVLVDALLLEKVTQEKNITLLLNTAVYALEKSAPDAISSVTGYCSQNQTTYEIHAPLFCDATGDGLVGFLAGAAFRMGAEERGEFGEGFAPTKEYGELLGHSLYFYSRDTGRPVRFIAPAFALKDITAIPRYGSIRAGDHGPWFWWFEYGGRLHTVHDTEAIKWELWKVVYGVWDYIKNSGRFPEAETMTLEWVGMIPGKRESRRFEGDYMLRQQDIVEQSLHDDAVSHGGWAIDLHPADGVYSELPSCTQWHSKGVYQIPYRCYYSRNIQNLFLAGRIVSASHVAFGSTRVMATCAQGAQAAGMAAVLCKKGNLVPRDLLVRDRMQQLQLELLKSGQYIPGLRLEDPDDLARTATISATSRMQLGELPPDGGTATLAASRAMLLPVAAGPIPRFSVLLDVARSTHLTAELRRCSRPGSFTPDAILASRTIPLERGDRQTLSLDFGVEIREPQYVFVCLLSSPDVSVHLSDRRVTGILSISHSLNANVAKSATQSPPEGIGVESFEFWLPQRRPDGKNLALTIDPPLDPYGPSNVVNGMARPLMGPNAWVAAGDDPAPRFSLSWPVAHRLAEVVLVFDTDFDHPMESVLWPHKERDMPFCVKDYRLLDSAGRVLHEARDNYQTRNVIRFDPHVLTSAVHVEISQTHGAPAAVFELRCYPA